MSLILALVTFRRYFLELCMTDVLSDQAQEVTASTLLKAGPALPQTIHLIVHLICSYARPAMASLSGDLHRHTTILTVYLFLLMSHLYFLHPSLITLFLMLPAVNSTTLVPFSVLWPLILNQSGI